MAEKEQNPTPFAGSAFDVAAYVWPSYHDDARARLFWPDGLGEFQTVYAAKPKFEGHLAPRIPLWGAVNEADPYVMSMQIDAAADHGVNVFIYDWYWYDRRPFLEACLNEGFLGAKNRERMRFYLMWANHNATTLWDKRLSDREESVVWLGSVDRAEFEVIGRRLIGRYFTHPLYYTVDGKPVFQIYDLGTLLRGLGGVAKTRDAFDWLRRACEEAGLPGLHLKLTLWNDAPVNATGVDGGNVKTTAELARDLGFDSMTHYQYVHFADMDRDYAEILRDAQAEWRRIDAEYGLPYDPHVSIGWDNNPRFHAFRPGVTTGNTPAALQKALEMARGYAETHGRRLITINSWNEWTETSCLQPDRLYGYGYLEAVKAVFKE